MMPTYSSQQARDKRLLPLLSESYTRQVLPQVLGTYDLVSLFILTVFWSSNVSGIVTGGAGGLTYWFIGALLFFVPCCLVTVQLAALFPHEGSIYNWTHHALGGFWSFFVGLCAWLPGVLSVVSAAFVVVSCLQVLNNQWLPELWQQGLVIIACILFAWFLSTQRTVLVRWIVNATALATIAVTLLIGLAAVFWLLTGHPSATNFSHLEGWSIQIGNPQTTNIGLLGTVTLALLGATMPLSMAGEVKHSRAITRHVSWGMILVLVGYLILTWGLLVVQGADKAIASPNPVALLIGTVDASFGKLFGNVVAVGILLFFIVVPVAENMVSARLLMVASIDGRIPAWLGQLNRHRAPARALLLQSLFTIIFTVIIYLVLPQFGSLGNPFEVNTKVYLITAASLLLVWAVSFLFPFINLAALYLRHRQEFRRRQVLPGGILLFCVISGPLICLATIVDTISFSWIPTLINNTTWTLFVIGLTFIVLSICIIGSMLATSEAGWEASQQEART